MMKRFVALALLMVCLCSAGCASASDWSDLLGGLTSMFGTKDEVTYSVGEPATVDDITITLKDVYQNGGSSFYQPEAGCEFVILEFQVQNNKKNDLSLSTMLSFSMWCDDTLYTIDVEALSTAMFSGKYQLDTVVEPGKKVTGVIGYQVPQSWKKIRVEFTPELLFGDKVTFLVEK